MQPGTLPGNIFLPAGSNGEFLMAMAGPAPITPLVLGDAFLDQEVGPINAGGRDQPGMACATCPADSAHSR